MLSFRVTTLSLVCLALPLAIVSADKYDLNGWYPCSDNTFSDEGSSTGGIAECAVYRAPLCYPGICETPPSVDSTVDIFVKQLPATFEDPAIATNVWFVAGGPGYSSSSLEWSMTYLHVLLEGKANIFTMDHRGTGRSTRLDCVSAQATTTGSPSSTAIDLSEVSACAQDLKYKYGDLSSFSMTTAATDIATFIPKYTNGKSTIVYGGSYGTALVERLMHLKNPTVIGYVLDGVATTSFAATEDKFPYISKYDIDIGEVGDAFLELCIDDDECSRYFKAENLSTSLRHLIEKFDKEPNSTCAQLVSTKGAPTAETPSSALRGTLGWMLVDSTWRTFIPPVVYRLTHCTKGDRLVLTQLLTSLKSFAEASTQDNAYISTLLNYLISFSEMWETPAPSVRLLKKRLMHATMYASSYPELYKMNQLYCAFSKEKSPTCDRLQLDNNGSSAIIYERDQYWNKTLVIPRQASVLLMSGKLDAQTSHKYAKALFEGLVGSNKELVTFEYATHGAIVSTPFGEAGEICGMNLLASYVKTGGNLDRLDKSCLDKMPALNLTISIDDRTAYLGTQDVYDGKTTRAGTSLSS
uniref:Peptidase S33 tripeptidyl aminopeptidase-like C-terminal domain-containing protein n=1 Tax=Hyaloperonospora arabidopsidis (strain Emoy2) TaxID=559515 RepID=M4BUM7_HYAAE